MKDLVAEPLAVAELTTFRMDYEQPMLIGWTQRSTWNGWGCPYFERDVADQVMRLVNAVTDDGETTIAFDQAADGYIVCSPADADESALVRGQDIVTAAGVKHVYALGAYEFCWHEQGVHFDS